MAGGSFGLASNPAAPPSATPPLPSTSQPDGIRPVTGQPGTVPNMTVDAAYPTAPAAAPSAASQAQTGNIVPAVVPAQSPDPAASTAPPISPPAIPSGDRNGAAAMPGTASDVSPPAPPSSDAISQAVQGVMREDDVKARAALRLAAGDPDKAAESVVLGYRAGLPPDVVQRNPDAVRNMVLIDDTLAYLTGAPELRRQFADPGFASMCIDDVPVLSSLERYLQAASRDGRLQPPAPTLGNTLYGLSQAPAQALRGMRIGIEEQATDWLTKAGILQADDPTSPDYYYRLELEHDFNDLQLEVLNSTPAFQSSTAKALYGGASGLMQMAPAVALTLLTENPAPLLWASALGTEAESYASLRSQGASTGGATWRALANGALAYGMGKLPVGTFFKSLDQGSTVALLTKVAGANATAAQVQSFVQDAIDMSVAHPDMTWSDFLKQRPGRAYETLVSSIFQSAVLAGLGRATLGQGNAGKQPGQGADRTEAENLTSNLRAAFDLARRSKLAGRDPGAFQHSVQQIANTHGIGTVHLASGKLMQALMAPGIDGAGVLRRMPATLAQLRDLPVQGGDLAIPTGELIAGISGSGTEETILPHLRRVPDALSLDQLRAVAQPALAGTIPSREAPDAAAINSPAGHETPSPLGRPEGGDARNAAASGQVAAPPQTIAAQWGASNNAETRAPTDKPTSLNPEQTDTVKAAQKVKAREDLLAVANKSDWKYVPERLEVLAQGEIDGKTYYGTNQEARIPERRDAQKPSLTQDKAIKRWQRQLKRDPEQSPVNASMHDAHAEIEIIQHAQEAGNTQGKDLTMVVRGKDVCTYCRGDVRDAAIAAGLNSVTIVNYDENGNLLHFYWKRGMAKMKEVK